ncbi:MAG: hypothetical protein JRJ37_02845 [Deltaproteobacteria bacterium]|nr:hypothetical protein [Deltaproteobacteria bacterium]
MQFATVVTAVAKKESQQAAVREELGKLSWNSVTAPSGLSILIEYQGLQERIVVNIHIN